MVVGVLGCMAERLKEKFLDEEKLVDIVVGPDAYRDLPNLIGEADEGRKAVNVILSKKKHMLGNQSCSIGRKWNHCFCFYHARL